MLSGNKRQINESPPISEESSIVAQLIWNNVLQGMPLDEHLIGIPAFISGMRESENHPAAHFEVYFGNIKTGYEYFHLHKLLQHKLEQTENKAAVNFPYEKYHQLLKELAFFTGFETWAHFKDDEQADLEEVIAAINLLKDRSRSPTLHTLSRKNIDELHARIYRNKKQREIQTAENYFLKISEKPDVMIIKENRLYFQRLSSGSGKKIERDSAVHLRYRMETLFGHVIYDSEGPELVELDRAMRGLQEGLIGLHEGEKGILFIHPEWADLDIRSPPYLQLFLLMPVEVVSAI